MVRISNLMRSFKFVFFWVQKVNGFFPLLISSGLNLYLKTTFKVKGVRLDVCYF